MILLFPVVALFGYGIYRLSKSSKIKNLLMLYTLIKNIDSKSLNPTNNSLKFIDPNIVEIEYSQQNNIYKLFVPFNKKLIPKQLNKKVYLLKDDSDRLDITQQPGMLYYFNASQLNGYSIEVEDGITGDSVILNSNQIPFE